MLSRGCKQKKMLFEISKIAYGIIELKFKNEYEDEEYISFEVAKMQNPDKFGRDYTVYCTTREKVGNEKPASKKPNLYILCFSFIFKRSPLHLNPGKFIIRHPERLRVYKLTQAFTVLVPPLP